MNQILQTAYDFFLDVRNYTKADRVASNDPLKNDLIDNAGLTHNLYSRNTGLVAFTEGLKMAGARDAAQAYQFPKTTRFAQFVDALRIIILLPLFLTNTVYLALRKTRESLDYGNGIAKNIAWGIVRPFELLLKSTSKIVSSICVAFKVMFSPIFILLDMLTLGFLPSKAMGLDGRIAHGQKTIKQKLVEGIISQNLFNIPGDEAKKQAKPLLFFLSFAILFLSVDYFYSGLTLGGVHKMLLPAYEAIDSSFGTQLLTETGKLFGTSISFGIAATALILTVGVSLLLNNLYSEAKTLYTQHLSNTNHLDYKKDGGTSATPGQYRAYDANSNSNSTAYYSGSLDYGVEAKYDPDMFPGKARASNN